MADTLLEHISSFADCDGFLRDVASVNRRLCVLNVQVLLELL